MKKNKKYVNAMLCTKCGFDNSEEDFPDIEGLFYCENCGEPLNDCCICASAKGTEILEVIDEKTFNCCKNCKEDLKERS